MRSSCITHPAREPLLVIRKSQIDFCQGNVCAAALLSFFEYWHNIRLDQAVKSEVENRIAEAHGEPPTQNISLWQFHTAEELSDGIMGLYSRNKITDGIDLLVKLGAIEVGRNPNERYKFDNTRYFLLNPALINAWLRVNSGNADASELTDRSAEIGRPSRSTGRPSRSNHATITETTEKITVGENPNSDFDFFSKNANGKSNGAGLVDAAELDGRVNRDYPQAIDREVGNLLDADQTGNGYSALNDPDGIAESPEQLAALQNYHRQLADREWGEKDGVPEQASAGLNQDAAAAVDATRQYWLNFVGGVDMAQIAALHSAKRQASGLINNGGAGNTARTTPKTPPTPVNGNGAYNGGNILKVAPKAHGGARKGAGAKVKAGSTG